MGHNASTLRFPSCGSVSATIKTTTDYLMVALPFTKFLRNDVSYLDHLLLHGHSWTVKMELSALRFWAVSNSR